MKKALALAFAFVVLTVHAQLPPLIPRESLFGAAENLSPSISPDGKRVAWLKPDERKVIQIWVRTIAKDDAKQLSHERTRPIFQYAWADDNRTIVYLQDSDGDENYHLYGIDLATGNIRDFTPWHGIHVEGFYTDRKYPDQLLVGLNVRDRKFIDMHRVNLRTGAIALDAQNPGDVIRWVPDDKMAVRGAVATTADGGTEIRWRGRAGSPWKVLVRTGPEEVVDLLDFTTDGKSVILKTSIGVDKARLVLHELATGKQR